MKPGATGFQPNVVITIYRQSPWSLHAQLPDFIDWVVCERFRALVEALEPGVHWFVPVAVYDRDGRPAPQAYLKLIVCQSARAILGEYFLDRPDPLRGPPGYPLSLREVADPAAVQGKHLWIESNPASRRNGWTFCSDALKQAVEAAHPRRLRFERVEFLSPVEFAKAPPRRATSDRLKNS